jgi:23S rRNA (cytosine1962-C5)-methyltransferase
MQPLFDAIASMSAPVDAQRIFHGRGGLHPECAHLSLDFFPPVWVLTSCNWRRLGASLVTVGAG